MGEQNLLPGAMFISLHTIYDRFYKLLYNCVTTLENSVVSIPVRARIKKKIVSRQFEYFCVHGCTSYWLRVGMSVPANSLMLFLVPF